MRKEENVNKSKYIKKVVRDAKDRGMKILIGGDMNGHIWELDKCENYNGKLVKDLVSAMRL